MDVMGEILSSDPDNFSMGGIFSTQQSRFLAQPSLLITGEPEDAALGLGYYMGVPDAHIFSGVAEGVDTWIGELLPNFQSNN